MSYNVTLYINSGFNSVNIPDTPKTLEKSSTVISVPSVNILQDKFLSSVDIRANWNTVESADYIKIGSFYYSINGIQMLNQETARISLIPDFITSAGGISKNGTTFDILDGITERQTVSEDNFGEYTDPDPLTAPQEPLDIFTEWKNPVTHDSSYILVSTTLDLKKMMTQKAGVTYTDEETGETVTVPKTYQAEQTTKISLPDSTHTVGDGTNYYIKTGGETVLPDGSTVPTSYGTVVEEGISSARALGVEGSILDQWQVPSDFMGYSVKDGSDITDGIGTLIGKSGTLTVSLKAGYAEVKNKRCLYGEYNKYGIMTSSGDSIEAKPEEITNGENPEITWKTDPRPKGRPYYRFTTMNNNTEFWRNAVAGETWEQVPLVYQGSSGSQLTRLNFDNSRRTQELASQQFSDRNALQQLQNAGQIGLGTAGMIGSGMLMGATGGLAGGENMLNSASQVLGGLNNVMSTELSRQQYMEAYKLDKSNELSKLYQNTTVYTPTVNFPYNSSIIRDIKGNGILVYRYHYTPTDLSRVDKLLTMYGYKESEPLTLTNFFRRTKFDYVQCSAVSVTGLPRWWNDGIADQLRNGIRVWHIKPDLTAYSNNPIV